MENNEKRKKQNIIGVAITIAVIIFLGTVVYTNYENLQAEKEIALKLAASRMAMPTPPPTISYIPTPTSTATPPPTQNQDILDLQAQYNNPEIIGRLIIPGTNIDYPIAQKKSDTSNSYYLYKDPYGNEDINGTLFMDYEDDLNQPEKNTIIYGHNMRENKMFHSIRYFSDQDYFDQHQTIIFETLNDTRIYRTISFMKPLYTFDYLTVDFKNDAQYEEMQKGIMERNVVKTDYKLTTDDQIINLSTCDNDTSNDLYRFVVTGVLTKTYALGEYVPELDSANLGD